MDQVVATAWLLLQEADVDPLDVAVACEHIKAFADARQLAAIQDLHEDSPAEIDPTGRMIDSTSAEIATALHWTPATAQRRSDLAQDLGDDLQGVHAALRAGQIDLMKAHEISKGTCELGSDTRRALAIDACEYASTHTIGQLRAWLSRRVASIDPDAVQRRRKKACTRRRVWIQPERDGMATIGAYLTAEEAQACFNSIQARVGNHEGSIDAARADQLVALLTGTEVGTPVPVQVILTSDGPSLVGFGPLSQEHASSLCEKAVRIHIKPGQATPNYRPGIALSRWVRARDRHCRFPGCRRPAANCDLDHLVPFPAGATSDANLACLCRRHHRLKTHTGWKVQRHPDDTLQWTSPRGRVYYTFPWDP